MDCFDFRKLAGRMLDGEAIPEDVAALEAHVYSCTRCGVLIGGLSALGRLHAGLQELEPSADLSSRIMAGIEEADAGRTGWMWKVLVPAAAAVFIMFGIQIGTQITDAWFGEAELEYADVTGLEYLEDYPPDSFGEAMELTTMGGVNE